MNKNEAKAILYYYNFLLVKKRGKSFLCKEFYTRGMLNIDVYGEIINNKLVIFKNHCGINDAVKKAINYLFLDK